VEPDRLLIEGCTLYDMGQVPDALRKWEQVLALDPTHSLALGYANGARRELGLPPLQASAPAAPAEEPAPAAEEDVAKLLREAVQLYDMGLTEEAISKWEHVLVLEPHREEIHAYLREARKELTQSGSQPVPQPAPQPAPRPAAAPAPQVVAATPAVNPEAEALALKLRQADHLLTLQRHDEAAFTYQQALQLAPGNREALAGLERCRRSQPAPAGSGIALDLQGRIAMAEEEPTLIVTDPGRVEPPASMTRTAPPPREGLALPARLQEASSSLPWLKEPKVWAMAGGGLLVLTVGLYALHTYRKDQELKEAVKAARLAALAPVLQQAQSPDLSETAAAILREGGDVLESEPVRAYLRAQAVLAQNPGDAAAAQLLEKARAALPAGGAAGATLAEFQTHLQAGDLDAAAKVMDALLRAQPDDPALRARAARLQLAFCEAHVGQGKWGEAAEDLRRGRALLPSDKSWQARLYLLERVKAMPKAQQAAWIPLLG
jgi:tetratricopeptide (TPR) repeat protein